MGKGVGGVGGMWEVGGAGDGFGRGEEGTAGFRFFGGCSVELGMRARLVGMRGAEVY